MTLNELWAYLGERLRDGVLTINDGEQTQYAFAPLLMHMRGMALTLRQCTLTRGDGHIAAEGLTAIPPLMGGAAFTTDMRLEIREGKIWFSLSLTSDITIEAQDFFGGTHPGYGVKDGRIEFIKSPLDGASLIRPSLHTDSDCLWMELPLRLEAGVSFDPGGPMGASYAAWAALAVRAEGGISLFSANAPGGGAMFDLNIPITAGAMPGGLFASLIQGGSLALRVRSHAQTDALTGMDGANALATRADIVCALNLTDIETPVVVTAALFDAPGAWHFGADFPEGLKPADLARFLLNLLGSPGAVQLPPSSPLENFRLYRLYFGFWDGGNSPNHIAVTAGLHQPWVLPLPLLTLENATVRWTGLFGGGRDNDSDFTMMAELYGMLSVTLPGDKKLLLSASVGLPSMELEARLALDDTRSVTLTDLMGQDPAAALGHGGKALAELGVYASAANKSLQIDAALRDVLAWSIGSIDFRLEEVAARVVLSQAGNTFMLSGLFRVGGGEDAFTFAVTGGYADGSWLFRGYLSDGQISIASLLLGFLSIRYSGERGDIHLTAFDLSYDTKSRVFALEAAFSADWGMGFGSIPVSAGGYIALRNAPDGLYAAALLGLSIGAFEISAQADDFFDEDRVRYIFQIKYGKRALRAIYAKQDVGGNRHEILTAELTDTTLGDLVLALIRAINPNHRYELPTPWNLLNKIDLSRLSLVYDLTDKSLMVSYTLNLNVAGLMTLNSVGLEYAKREGDTSHTLRFVVKGTPTGASIPQTYGWDAMKGTPPPAVKGGDRFKLHYLGLGSHLSVPDAIIADTVEQAVQALKDGFSPEDARFDAETGWLLGADFTINGALNVQLAFIDPALYGAVVTVSGGDSPFKSLAGLRLELIYKKVSKDIGMFRVSLMIPDKYRRFQLGALNITLGLLSAEIYTNGDFLVDLGFPHGGDFSRSFSVEAGIYIGRGGLYLGALSGQTAKNLPSTTKGTFTTVIALGVGLSLGIGRSFDFGVVKGGLSLEVSGIFEGVFAAFEPNGGGSDMYYSVKATVAVVGRIYLSVDLFVITIQASVELKAYASVEMTAYRPMLLEMGVSLKMSAYVTVLFVKVEFSYTFTRRFSFEIGKGGRAPWDALPPPRAPLPRLIFFEPVELGWMCCATMRIPPMFSLSDGLPCAAFAPIMDTADFADFFTMLAEWTILPFPDSIPYELAQMLSFDTVRERVGYTAITDFFDMNLRLKLVGDTLALCRDGGERAGVILPMPPPAVLTLSSQGMYEPFCSDYDADNIVPPGYIEAIARYFDTLNPDRDKPDPAVRASDAEGQPLARVVFVDYVHLLLREIIGLLHGLFRELPMSGADAMRSMELCGVPFARLLADNPRMAFNVGSLVISDCTSFLDEGDSVASEAARRGLDARELWACVAGDSQLLLSGAKVGLEAFDGSISQRLPLRRAAALFYVRRHGLPPYGWEREWVTALQDKNAWLDPDWEEDSPDGRDIALPDGSPYTSMPGDNLMGLAKALALEGLAKGVLPAWDAYAEAFSALNGGADIDGALRLPADTLAVEGDVNPGALARRIHPSPARCLYDLPILAPRAVVTAPLFVAVNDGDTAEDIIGASGVKPALLADALTRAMLPVAANQTLLVYNAPFIAKELVLSLLLDKGYALQTGAAVSRFMLQGLRLPTPEQPANDMSTAPYYALTRQQAPLADDDEDYLLEIAAYPNCAWLTGSISDPLPWSLIAPNLPAPDFDWTDSIRSCAPLEATSSVLKSYTAAPGVPLAGPNGNETLHPLPAELIGDLPHMEGISILGRDGAVEPAAYIPFTVRRTAEPGVFEVEGVEASRREHLSALAKEALGGGMTQTVYFRANPLQAEDAWSTAQWDGGRCAMIRANLSLQTHRAPVASFNAPRQDVCQISDPIFPQTLWECSVVGGGGYFLRLVSTQGHTLQDAVFGEDGRAELRMIVRQASDALATPQRLVQTGLANAALTPPLAGEQAVFAPIHPLDAQPYADRPSMPPGCIGFALEMDKPGDSSPEEAAQRLFSIIEYTISGEGIGAPPDSVPLTPDGADGDDSWRYNAVIPVYKLFGDGEDKYAALGKPLTITLRCRDLLGNRAPGEYTLSGYVPAYNDELIPINQWPATDITYHIDMDESELVAELSARERDELAEPSLGAALMRRTAAQWERTIEVRLSFTPFDTDNIIDKEPLLAFIQAHAAYLDGVSDPPPACVLRMPLQDTPAVRNAPYPLAALLSVSRLDHLPESPAMRRFTHDIAPAVVAGDEGSILRFARALEAAIPHIKLALGDSEKWMAVPVGPGGAIERISIKPYTRLVEGVTVTAPVYLGIRPLSNTRVGRETIVHPLNPDGTLNRDAPALKNHPSVDIDEWGGRFLRDLEGFLSHRAALAPEAAVLAIAAKDALAQAVSKQLIPIERDFTAQDGDASDLLFDRMRRSLNIAAPFAAVAAYSARLESGIRCRLPVLLRDAANKTTGDEGGLRADAGKLDSEKTSFHLIYETDEAARTGFTTDFDIEIAEMEYDIAAREHGYETSKWLRFVLPITTKSPIVDASLSSDLSVPNPLRHCPAAPELDGQDAAYSEDVLHKWEYLLHGVSEMAMQDEFHIEIAFGVIDNTRAAQSDDLLTALCRYDHVRGALLAMLDDPGGTAFKNACGTFAELAGQIAELWPLWLYVPPHPSANVYDWDMCTVNMRALFDGGARLETDCPWLGVWAEIDAGREIRPGQRAGYTLHIPDLSIHRYSRAVPSVQTIRNAGLLRVRGGALRAPVDPRFIYRSDTINLPPFHAGREVSRELAIYSTTDPLGEHNLSVALDKLFSVLGIEGEDVRASFVVSCAYSPDGSDCSVELPVGMFPAKSCLDGAAKHALQTAISGWLEANRPDRTRLSLLVRAVISPARRDATLLALNRIRMDFGVALERCSM